MLLNADRCRSKAAGEAAISHPAVICWLYQATAGLGLLTVARLGCCRTCHSRLDVIDDSDG